MSQQPPDRPTEPPGDEPTRPLPGLPEGQVPPPGSPQGSPPSPGQGWGPPSGQQPPQPPYGPPTAQQPAWGQPPPPRPPSGPSRPWWRRWWVIALGVIVVLAVIGSLTSDPKPDTTAGQAPTSAPVTATPATDTEAATTDTTEPPTTEKPTTTKKPTPTTKPAPTVLLQQTGSGTHNLRPFTAPDQWRLVWSYDCRNFGGQGNFAVNDSDFSTDLSVNELGRSGSGTEYVDGGGRVKLQVLSECRWSLKVLEGQ